jgi:hypothetical protein
MAIGARRSLSAVGGSMRPMRHPRTGRAAVSGPAPPLSLRLAARAPVAPTPSAAQRFARGGRCRRAAASPHALVPSRVHVPPFRGRRRRSG